MEIKLYKGDCFGLLKQIKNNTIDLVLIDPHYEVSRDTNFAKGKIKGTDVDRFRVSMKFALIPTLPIVKSNASLKVSIFCFSIVFFYLLKSNQDSVYYH